MYWDRANRGHGKCTGTELTGGMVSVLGQSYSWDRANRGHGKCTGLAMYVGLRFINMCMCLFVLFTRLRSWTPLHQDSRNWTIQFCLYTMRI